MVLRVSLFQKHRDFENLKNEDRARIITKCVLARSKQSKQKKGLVETNPLQVLGTGVEPVRALLPTGF